MKIELGSRLTAPTRAVEGKPGHLTHEMGAFPIRAGFGMLPRSLMLGLACFLLAGMAPESAQTVPAWLAWLSLAGAAGLLPMAAAAPGPNRRRWLVVGALAGVAVISTLLAETARWGHLTWIAAVGVLAVPVEREFLRLAREGARAEAARWVLLCAGAATLFSPFATAALVGGGDARIYAQTLADFLRQLQEGVLPVLVGQTEFAPNAEFHPLRTAPGFHHWGGLAWVLTGGSLPAAGLQNLLVFTHGIAAAFTCYGSLRRCAPGFGWTALLLAGLYVTSPGILAPLYGGDMIATWLTLPWLPLFFLGLIQLVDDPAALRWGALAALALAALWLNHAPIAFWCSVCALPFVLVGLVRRRFAPAAWRDAFALGTACLLLCAYVFASALALQMPPDVNLRESVRAGAIEASTLAAWSGFARPVSTDASALLSDLQLSPGLWLALALGLLAVARIPRVSHRLLLGVCALLLFLLLPPLGRPVWGAMPDLVLNTTEKWPAQRFFVILSAVAPFLGFVAVASWWPARQKLARDATILLCAALGWSVWEAGKFVRRGYRVTHPAAETRQLFTPGNLPLPRYSFEYIATLPRTFSHGPVAVESQVRLLDPDTLEVTAANATGPGQSARSPLVYHATDYGGYFTPALALAAGELVQLEFSFSDPAISGALQLQGRHVLAEYSLPSSGEAQAFGAAPSNVRTLLVRNHGADADAVNLKFIRTPGTPAGRAVRAEIARIEDDALPVQIRDLVPLRATVQSAGPAWLETPRLHLPGFVATVDGRTVPAAPSPDGLVMVPVPAGRSEVVLSHPGPLSARLAFWLTLAAWLAVVVWFIRPAIVPAPAVLLPRLAAIGVVGAAAVVVAFLFRPQPAELPVTAPPAVEEWSTNVHLPLGTPGSTTDLVQLDGNVGKIVLQYVDGKTARLGLVRAGAPAVFGPGFPVNYRASQHRLELRPGADPGRPEVRFNHRLVLGPSGR